MNKVLLSALLVSTSIICMPATATPPFNEIHGLSYPFASKGKIYLSPPIGLEDQQLREIRFWGNYGPEASNFPRVNHNRLKKEDGPQGPEEALIQRLFPSPAHDVLTPNNLQQDPIKKWLKPAAIAKIFNHIDNSKKFSNMSENERLLGFLAALTPEEYERLNKAAKGETDLKNKIKLKNKEVPDVLVSDVLFPKFKGRDSFDFASLLDQAIQKSRNPNPEDKYFYPPHTIESALLTYMWRQAPNKLALKEYYGTLSADLMDKAISVDFKSSYTKDDYFALKDKVNSGKLPIEEFMKDPEKMSLLAFGYSYFEDFLPPAFPYGPVKFVDPDGKAFSYTNCGEMLLMTLFDAVNFDPEDRSFASSRLENLKEKEGLSPHKELIKFYSETNTHPTQSNTQVSLNAWSQLVSNLNLPTDPDPVHYLQNKGRKVKSGNGIYELGDGLHNLLRVVGKLLGDREWKPMNQTGEDLSKAIQANLDRFCTLFSRRDFISDWHVKDTKTKEIKDPNQVDIIFETDDEEDLFELHVNPGHFE